MANKGEAKKENAKKPKLSVKEKKQKKNEKLAKKGK
jgi:hypothetical protein